MIIGKNANYSVYTELEDVIEIKNKAFENAYREEIKNRQYDGDLKNIDLYEEEPDKNNHKVVSFVSTKTFYDTDFDEYVDSLGDISDKLKSDVKMQFYKKEYKYSDVSNTYEYHVKSNMSEKEIEASEQNAAKSAMKEMFIYLLETVM